jgi:hypothetical protein
VNLDEIEAELARWSFMPGWSFRLMVLEPMIVGGIRLRAHTPAILKIVATVPNSYRPDETIKVESNAPVPVELFERHPEAFPGWLRQMVHARMCHEADEWLKRDGVMTYDPHAKERSTR